MTVATLSRKTATLIERRYGRKSPHLLSWSGLPGLGFGAFLQGGFARKFHPAFVIDPDTFHPNHVASLHDVFGSFHPKIRQLGDVDQPVLARENFDKRAELLRRNDAALIGLADLDLACHPTDDLFRARHALAAGRVNVDRTIILDVNFCAGFGDDALDRFPARPDKRPDLLRINFDRLNP